MAVKLLITGSKGQVGHCLLGQSKLLDWTIQAVDRDELDICDRAAVLRTVGQWQPQVIINAAAHTAVDKAESEIDASYVMTH